MKKQLLRVVAVILMAILLLTCVTSAVYGWWIPTPTWKFKSNSLDMYYSCVSSCCCGPSSGVSIGWYYKTRPSQYGQNYPILPGPTEYEMYGDLYDYMDTSDIFECYTDHYYYGYGFLEMTRRAGYHNFSFVVKGKYSENVCWGGEVDSDDFWNIKDAIDNGWPVALEGNFKDVDEISGDETDTWPCTEGHYIAIKGYSYWEYSWPWSGYIVDTDDWRIECTDSYSHSHELELAWDDVVQKTLGLKTYIIKDEIPEDFEWGSDGTSLGADGGDVDWTVTKDGNSVAEIDTYYHSGSRCAKFYYDGDPDGYNYVRGYYSEYRPIWRGFWLKKDHNSVFYTRTGDGAHSILVRVLNSASGGKLQYYDGGWKDTRRSITDTQWHFIEFRVIDWWGPYRYNYSIYVDNDWVKSGVPMHTETAYNGKTAYYGANYEGSFWIDDIPSSLR